MNFHATTIQKCKKSLLLHLASNKNFIINIINELELSNNHFLTNELVDELAQKLDVSTQEHIQQIIKHTQMTSDNINFILLESLFVISRFARAVRVSC
jgi:hypothetical protein